MPTSDKAHKINDLWALFFLFRAILKTNKFPKQTKLSYQIVTEKTGFWNCNDFLCKSLICRLLSLKCPLVNQLLIFPLQAMCNSCNEGAKLKGL